MGIVSSTYTVGVAQVDGRRYVTERHTDANGTVWPVEYGPVPVIDYQATMTARATKLGVQLADNEAESLWTDGVWRTLTQQTASELATRFRTAYQAATDLKAARMAWWIIERINAGNFTDAQVRTAFGMTTTQYTAMKTRMTTLHDQYAAVVAARGE